MIALHIQEGGTMFEAIYQFIEKLFTRFSWPRLLFLVLVMLFLFLALLVFETYTDMMRLGRMDRCVGLLKDLATLEASSALSSNATLQQIHSQLGLQLEALVLESQIRTTVSPTLLKLLTATIPWFITMLLFARRSTRENRSLGLTIASFVILALPFVIISTVLPLCSRTWINYVLYPWGSYLAFLVVILVIQGVRKRKRKSA